MKRSSVLSLLCVGILASSTTGIAADSDQGSMHNGNATNTNAASASLKDELDRIAIGLRIAPVTLNLRGKNISLVGLGSYLVNAGGGCNDCHTHPSFAPGGNPFLGQPEVINSSVYLSGGRTFGPVTSKNITPDANGRPAGLTFPEFENLLRTGRDPDNANKILQVMPWNVYGRQSSRDLRAIYEYLSSIPSLPNNPNPGP